MSTPYSTDFATLVQQAEMLRRGGRYDEGIVLADRAARLNPGHAAPFTLKATMALRRRFGPPPPPRLPDARPGISMRTLGGNGRFGNQLLQYAFLRLYAEAHGLNAEAPDWIGRDLFACDDPLPLRPFPSLDETQCDLFASLNGRHQAVYAHCDLTGYFCRHTSAWQGRQDAFRALFRPAPRIEAFLQPALAELGKRGKTLVAVHLRRGDFGYGPFWIAPTAWYVSWLDAIWDSLEEPLLYVASDDSSVAAEFARFAPVDARMLEAGDLDFYLDHFVLCNAAPLATSNSTFSFTAAMLNANDAVFVRPDPNKTLMPFDPWNADVLLQPKPA